MVRRVNLGVDDLEERINQFRLGDRAWTEMSLTQKIRALLQERLDGVGPLPSQVRAICEQQMMAVYDRCELPSTDLPPCAQHYQGHHWAPVQGCDTLQMMIDGIVEALTRSQND